MSTQVKQIVFVVLAVILVGFVILMVRPQDTKPVAQSPASNAPVGSASNQQPLDQAAQQRFSEVQEKVKQNPKDVNALAELAAFFYEQQQFAQAADTYSSLLEIDPKDSDARTKLATAYFFQGMAQSAIREYKAVVAAEPANAEAHFYLALALSHSNPPDLESAMKSWQEVVKIAPDSDLAKKSQSFIDAYQKQK